MYESINVASNQGPNQAAGVRPSPRDGCCASGMGAVCGVGSPVGGFPHAHKDEHLEASPSRQRTEPEPPPDVSTRLETALALMACAALVVTAACCLPEKARVAVACVWAVQALRLHLQLWLWGAWGPWQLLCRRFPHAYFWTIGTLPLCLASKCVQLVASQIFPDDVGRIYRCTAVAREPALSIVRWWRAAVDLRKPLRSLRSPPTDPAAASAVERPRARIGITTFLATPTVAVNLHWLGPLAAFDVLRAVCSENHVVMRNDLLGTHLAYNHHVSAFVDSGVLYWTIADAAVVPPVSWLLRAQWHAHALSLHSVIGEAEARASVWPTLTYKGSHFWTDMDTPTLDELFYRSLHTGTRRRLSFALH